MLGEEVPGPRGPWRALFMVSPESEQVFLGKEMGAHVSDYIDQQVEAGVCNSPKLEISQMSGSRRMDIHARGYYTAKRTHGPQRCTVMWMNLKHSVGMSYNSSHIKFNSRQN